jgi:hypothetical protein
MRMAREPSETWVDVDGNTELPLDGDFQTFAGQLTGTTSLDLDSADGSRTASCSGSGRAFLVQET